MTFSKDQSQKRFKVSGIPSQDRLVLIFCSKLVASVQGHLALFDQISPVEIRKSKLAAAERTAKNFLTLIKVQDTPTLNAGITLK